jgi:hypothetical protein
MHLSSLFQIFQIALIFILIAFNFNQINNMTHTHTHIYIVKQINKKIENYTRKLFCFIFNIYLYI